MEPRSPPDLRGKTVLVTGGSTGMGLETCVALAGMGARVLFVCRGRQRADAALADIRARSGSDRVEALTADLSEQREVERLATEVRGRTDRLDVLVNNAGLYLSERRLTSEGRETTFALNHLGYFLTTALLFDLLRRGAPSRVVSVSSAGHAMGTVPWDDLLYERQFLGVQAYCDSKLMNILFTFELARRAAGTWVTANCVHPGAVATRFAADAGGWFHWAMKLTHPFQLSPAKGARTSIFLASSPEVEGATGGYYVRTRLATPSKAARDPDAARRLWEVSEHITGVRFPVG